MAAAENIKGALGVSVTKRGRHNTNRHVNRGGEGRNGFSLFRRCGKVPTHDLTPPVFWKCLEIKNTIERISEMFEIYRFFDRANQGAFNDNLTLVIRGDNFHILVDTRKEQNGQKEYPPPPPPDLAQAWERKNREEGEEGKEGKPPFPPLITPLPPFLSAPIEARRRRRKGSIHRFPKEKTKQSHKNVAAGSELGSYIRREREHFNFSQGGSLVKYHFFPFSMLSYASRAIAFLCDSRFASKDEIYDFNQFKKSKIPSSNSFLHACAMPLVPALQSPAVSFNETVCGGCKHHFMVLRP